MEQPCQCALGSAALVEVLKKKKTQRNFRKN